MNSSLRRAEIRLFRHTPSIVNVHAYDTSLPGIEKKIKKKIVPLVT